MQEGYSAGTQFTSGMTAAEMSTAAGTSELAVSQQQ
jgi:hypothetical protein